MGGGQFGVVEVDQDEEFALQVPRPRGRLAVVLEVNLEAATAPPPLRLLLLTQRLPPGPPAPIRAPATPPPPLRLLLLTQRLAAAFAERIALAGEGNRLGRGLRGFGGLLGGRQRTCRRRGWRRPLLRLCLPG